MPDSLNTVSNLGSLLQAQGNLAKAEQFYRRALEGRERILGVDHPDTCLTVEHLRRLLDLKKSNKR